MGTVLDASTARPINGATVEVVGQSEVRVRTDLDGTFTLSLAAGTYQLRVSASLYKDTVLQNVTATPGQPNRISTSLTAKVGGSVEVVEVVADVTESTEATQLLKRKLAPNVRDNLGAEAISRTPDSDAAEVVTRVPAVTIKDDKFIIVRGLAERYSSALLNGSRLPSTDPNRRIVPLDIFPADFIQSLSLVKTYTPDLPGDFSGGLVDVALAEPAPELTYSFGWSLGFNTATTFQDHQTYDSTSADWFTLGDSFRDLPGIFGDGPIGGNLPTQRQRAYVGALPLNWNVHDSTAPPNFSLDGSVGNSWGPFGFNFAASYGWKFAVRRDEIENGFLEPDDIPDGGEQFVYEQSDFEVQLGAVLTTQYKISNDHKIAGRALVNRQGVDEVQTGSGEDRQSQQGRIQRPTSSVYTTSQLGFGQLEGCHHFSLADLDWRASWAPSNQGQPDAKFYIYDFDPSSEDPVDRTPALTDLPPSTQRTFTTLSEFLQDYYVDGTVSFRTQLPFTDVWRGLTAQLKTGLAYTLRNRSFLFRSFRTVVNRVPRIDRIAPPDQLLVPQNYAGAGPFFEFQGLQFEPFDASQEIAGAYGMVDLPIISDQLRLIAGSRVEYSYLVTNSRDPFGQSSKTILNDVDPMPAFSLVYNPRDDMNVRFAFSQTVSRPEFRELTPTRLPTLPGERILQGNPELVSAQITNYDLRWEWFFTPLELVSVSFFFKDLTDPIELVTAVETSNLLDVYVNSNSATVSGFEFEGRKNFDFAVPYARRLSWLKPYASALADVTFLLNASVIESTVSDMFRPPPGVVIVPIQGTRALQGQSPFVINTTLEYEHARWGIFRLLYNTIGPTIAAAGTDLQPETPEGILPDIITQRRDQLDFVWLLPVATFGTPATLKVAAENILNDDYLETQGDGITNRYRTGVTFSMGISYSF